MAGPGAELGGDYFDEAWAVARTGDPAASLRARNIRWHCSIPVLLRISSTISSGSMRDLPEALLVQRDLHDLLPIGAYRDRRSFCVG